jgi:hypothetical protein
MSRASFKLSGEDILGALVSHLEHLDACKDFILEFRSGGFEDYALQVAKEEKSEWSHTRLVAALRSYNDFVSTIAMRANTVSNRGHVTELLECLESLKLAKDVVAAIASAIGHYDPKIPRDFSNRLDSLTGFDDSE